MATQTPDLLKAALWYAQHGYFVFPLHTPIFDRDPSGGGNVSGCSCEEWKRKQPQYGPDYKCDQPGKCPRVKWHDKSSIDLGQIREWWRWWPDANIGIDAGKSELLILDADSYKDTYAGDDIQMDQGTVTSRTGGGGSHLWYRQPAGKAYGNATGELPAGIDIRGHGGYIVAPPSLHKSGQRYRFQDDHSPKEISPLPLPLALAAILDAAQVARGTVPVNFTVGNTPLPDLSHWQLHGDVLEMIANGAPKGGRSEADWQVISALAKAGASDDQIRAVFVHFAIGEKYGERGDRYLALTIGKVRARLADHPPDSPAVAEQLAKLRGWVRSPECIARLRSVEIPREFPNKKGEMHDHIRRVADLVPLLDAIVEIAQTRRTTRIVSTVRDIADRCGLSSSTAHRRLMKLEAAELLTTKPDPYGTLIDLSSLLALSGTVSQNVESVPLSASSQDDFFADHRCDDVFASYPYSYAIKRRQAPTVLMQSLGASGLLLWDALASGGTINELAEVTGLTWSGVRVTVKRFERCGLVVVWQEGRSNFYELHPNAEERVEERREHMATAGIGQLRAARNANDRATFAQRKLQGRMPLEPRQKAKLENRRDKSDAKAEAHYDALFAMGINPYAKVRHREPRLHMKMDHGEEWISVHRPIVEAWDDLAPLPYVDRYHMMSYAGYEQAEIDRARHAANRMGRGPRVFVGINDPGQVVAA